MLKHLEKQDNFFEGQKKKWDLVYKKEKLIWTHNRLPKNILKQIYKLLPKKPSILDFGCGEGVISAVLIKDGFTNITCSDISENALLKAKERLQSSNIKFISTYTPASLDKNSFNFIISWGVFHHIPKEKWNYFLKEFVRIIKTNGILLISGHSKTNEDFKKGFRISPTTKEISYALEDLKPILLKNNFEIINEGLFHFKEAFTEKERNFKFFICKVNKLLEEQK